MRDFLFECKSVAVLGTMSSGAECYEILLERWNAETLSTESVRLVRLIKDFVPGKQYVFVVQEVTLT